LIEAMSKISEHYLYPKIEEWLDNVVGCQYTAVRNFYGTDNLML